MGYRLNRLDEPVFMARPKPMRTEFDILHRLENCVEDKSVETRKVEFLSQRLVSVKREKQ